jgi:hypothetical protein
MERHRMKAVDRIGLAVDELAREGRGAPSRLALARLTRAIDDLERENFSRLTTDEIGEQLLDLSQHISIMRGLRRQWESRSEPSRKAVDSGGRNSRRQGPS